MPQRLHHLRDRLARKRGPVAFVLSGGGPFGALQVGYLQALAEFGIVPDLVIGTSVGALNASIIANDPTERGAQALTQVWLGMRKDDMFPGGRFETMMHAMRRGSHVYSNAGLRRTIASALPLTFEELALPLHVVATDLATGDEKWFTSGELMDPLLASAAMPGVFPPVEINGTIYIDGGVSNNVPVSRAIELGARHIHVLNVNASGQGRALNRPHDFMMQGLVLARGQRYRRDLEKYRAQATIHEFPAVQVGHIPFTSLEHTERLIKAGHDEGLKFLETEAGAVAAADR